MKPGPVGTCCTSDVPGVVNDQVSSYYRSVLFCVMLNCLLRFEQESSARVSDWSLQAAKCSFRSVKEKNVDLHTHFTTYRQSNKSLS